ncbi:MAG: endolytic transglycosylase MltG [Myxococcota bacterium]
MAKRTKRHAKRTKGTSGRRWERRLVGLLALVVALGLGAVSWLLLVFPHEPTGPRGERFELDIAPGSSARTIAAQLADAGVIAHPGAFAMYVRLLGLDAELRSGPVLLEGGLTPEVVAQRIAFGRGPVPVRVTIPEGFTRFDIARRLEARGVADAGALLELIENPPAAVRERFDLPEDATLEGYLFPETYDFKEGMRPGRAVWRMLRTWDQRVAGRIAEGLGALEDLGYDARDVLTLASVVEKEAAVADERPIIAGVFLNRLRSDRFLPRHRLQADPTVSYGCLARPEAAPSCAGFDGTITRAMLGDRANPYNTYMHPGLPPGPIANPGMAAIEAVLEPAAHDYLYFVARGGGRHAFSADLDAHREAVRALRAREARGE